MSKANTDLNLKFHIPRLPVKDTYVTVPSATEQQRAVSATRAGGVQTLGGDGTVHATPSVTLNVRHDDVFIHQEVVTGL